MAKIDAGLLEGLKFRTNKKASKIEEGKRIEFFVPDEIDLESEHVLSFKDKGDHVVIVAADGQKHSVTKKPTKKEDKK